MKNKTILIAFLLQILSAAIFAQSSPADKLNDLEHIYSNLEYKTTAYNDLKAKWYVTDPLLVRNAFNKFVVQNALRVDGKVISNSEVEKKAIEIFDGNVLISVRKRYYDDEIEYFAFMQSDQVDKKDPDLLFDEITDGFYLKELIGEQLYGKIQDKSYFYSDLSKDEFNTKPGHFFDINLQLLNPDLMFWSTTSGIKNKYLVYFMGQWGLDRVFIPGWYFPEYSIGLKLDFYSSLSTDREDYAYSLSLGTGFKASSPFPDELPEQPLYKSGQSIYFRISADPLQLWETSFKHLYLDVEGLLTMSENKPGDYRFSEETEFYSLRNYMSAMLRKRNLADLADLGKMHLGAGVASHDINRYQFVPDSSELIDLIPERDFFSRFEHYAFGEIGVSKTGGLLQHDINIRLGYNFMKEYYMITTVLKFMLSDTFGLDIRYTTSFDLNPNTTPWRNDSYLVFSPILRINY
jgi:hypothetical protein